MVPGSVFCRSAAELLGKLARGRILVHCCRITSQPAAALRPGKVSVTLVARSIYYAGVRYLHVVNHYKPNLRDPPTVISEIVIDICQWVLVCITTVLFLEEPSPYFTGAKTTVMLWQGQIFFHTPDSRHYFNRIRQVTPTAQERANRSDLVIHIVSLCWTEWINTFVHVYISIYWTTDKTWF